MDVFVEQIIAKKKTAKDLLIIIASIIGFIIITFLILAIAPNFIGPLTFFLIFGLGYGLWWLLTSLNIEYEYSVTNGDIDIDQIIAKRKRKGWCRYPAKGLKALSRTHIRNMPAAGSTGR